MLDISIYCDSNTHVFIYTNSQVKEEDRLKQNVHHILHV